jgi:hypothetical protein
MSFMGDDFFNGMFRCGWTAAGVDGYVKNVG